MYDTPCWPCDESVVQKYEYPPCPLQCGSEKCHTFGPGPPVGKRPIVWVLGGPGSGKGTQCQKINEKYGFVHLSTGDLLRAEALRGSDRSKYLADLMERGELAPNDLVLDLLKEAILEKAEKATGFLIDGYPREKSQGEAFEKTIGPVTIIIYFEVSTATLFKRMLARAAHSYRFDTNETTIKLRLKTFYKNNDLVLRQYPKKMKRVIISFEATTKTLKKRLLSRAASSGRIDDNKETIKLRLKTFHDNNDLVLAQYPDKIKRINAEASVDEIFAQVESILDPIVAQYA